MVPPPAGLSHNRRRTLPGSAFIARVGSSRAHSRNYHNEESTAGVRIERTFSLPITRFRAILASGIEPDSVPCSSMLSSLCPGLFPGVTPFRRAGGAHVVPETPGLHIPVVRIAHGTSREPSGLLTLHVPYNGREYCRSQLEAHSFSYKPVPTTDEDGMRFHVVYDSPTPVRRRHLAGADAKDRYAIIRLVGMAGSIKSRHRGFCFSAPISPPLLFSAQTEKIAFNAVGFRHVRSGIFGRGAGDQPAQPLQY